MKFALRNKVPDQLPEPHDRTNFVKALRDSVLESLGILHTKQTLVGNEFVRGVSGGERKRVSVAEVMAGQSPVQCWDNSTRGLDSSAALNFGQILRSEADEDGKTIVATLYQAGNALYGLFDKVLVLCEGRMIYFGPRQYAREYFETMGFVCPRGANIADFLTSVTVSTERTIRPGFEGSVPNTAAEFEARFRNGDVYQRMVKGMREPDGMAEETEVFRNAVLKEKRKAFLSRSPSVYTVSLWDQIVSCTIRYA